MNFKQWTILGQYYYKHSNLKGLKGSSLNQKQKV